MECQIARNLALAVSFFFVLSGFILTYRYSEGVDRVRFYKGRMMRLWPVHLTILVVGIIIGIFRNPIVKHENIPVFFANVLLLQAWVPYTVWPFSFNGVTWSISAEVFFYALFPFLVVGNRWRHAAIVSAIIIAAMIVAIDYYKPPAGTGKLWTFAPEHFVLQNPGMRVLEFIIGIGFCKSFLAHRRSFNDYTATMFEVGAIISVVSFAMATESFPSIFNGLPATVQWLSQSGGMLIFGAAILVFAYQQGAISKILIHPLLVRLGEISFSTYMLHHAVEKFSGSHKWAAHIGVPATAALCVIIIYAASYLMWKYVEEPARKWSFRRPNGGLQPAE